MQPPGGTKFLHFSLKKFPRELFLKFEKTFQKGDGVFGAFPDDDFHRHTPVLMDSYTGYADVRECVKVLLCKKPHADCVRFSIHFLLDTRIAAPST